MTYIVSGGALNSTHSLDCETELSNQLKTVQQNQITYYDWLKNSSQSKIYVAFSQEHFILFSGGF